MEPRFLETHWNKLGLADLGVTREIPRVRESCEYWMMKSRLVGRGVGGLEQEGGACNKAAVEVGVSEMASSWTPRRDKITSSG